jgi:putative addiction module component (TIGR02574 family)
MKTDQIKDEFSKLEISQKLLLVEDLWDDIANSNVSLSLNEWQKQELDRRLAAYKSGELKTIDWKSAHKSLRQRHQ